MFNLIIKILLITNVSNKKELLDIGYIDEIYLPNFDSNIAYSEKEILNDIIIDIFLVLTNDEEAVIAMKNKNLKGVLYKINDKLIENENLKDRLFVITNYIE